MMNRCIFLVCCMFFAQVNMQAQASVDKPADSIRQDKILASDEEQIKSLLNRFFEGLQEGDTTIVKETIDLKNLKVQTIGTNRAGNSVIITQSVVNFLKSIATKKITDSYKEELLAYNIKIDGSLASAWTPYHFYFNKKFSHCGVNSFQFFNDGLGWKMIYLIDTRRRKGCK